MPHESAKYIGNELELFAHASNWKAYWNELILKYINGQVLEVGGGIGGTTKVLLEKHASIKNLLVLEPDAELSIRIPEALTKDQQKKIEVRAMTTKELEPDESFDSILYIDVIEHIKDDGNELQRASKLLKSGGYLIILVPAHNFLYSRFDKAIGHYRRYNKKMIRAVIPEDLQIELISYLDSLGLMASLGNKLLLKQAAPSLKQIKFWDSFIIKCSRFLDPLLGFNLGKSLLVVLRKT